MILTALSENVLLSGSSECREKAVFVIASNRVSMTVEQDDTKIEEFIFCNEDVKLLAAALSAVVREDMEE